MAKLQMDKMDKITQAFSIRQLIESFSEHMRKIDERVYGERVIEQETFRWVFHSRRPLTVRELQCALSLEVGNRKFDPDGVILESDILDVCGALVTVERESNIVRFVHYSVQEYLEVTSHVAFPGIHVSITLKCLTCLSLDDFRAGPCTSDAELENRLKNIPLVEYAAKH